MSPGVTFRCTCDHCGAIFFGADRKSTACMKCAKRYKIRTETPPRPAAVPEDDLFAAALASSESPGSSSGVPRRAPAPLRPQSEAPAAPRASLGHAARPAPAPRAPASAPAPPVRAPRGTDLTDEKRAEVLRAYQEYDGRDEVPLRRIHAEIAEKANLARALVARVISDVRTPPAVLSEEQREAVVARYREFVRGMSRPPLGRRATIAKDLGIGRQQVVTVVREWAASQPSITDLSREDLFRVESAFWAALHAGESYDGLTRRIAARFGHTEWQVERWVDMLHDGDFTDVEDPAADQREAVIAAYQEYLQGEGPPPKSLHVVLGDRFGLSPRQVHKVLVDYRVANRQRQFGF